MRKVEDSLTPTLEKTNLPEGDDRARGSQAPRGDAENEDPDADDDGNKEETFDLKAPRYITETAAGACLDCGKRSNRHESLFLCGRWGLLLYRFWFQFLFCTSALLLIALCFYHGADIHAHGHGANYLLLVIDFGVCFVALFLGLPGLLRKFAVITNVFVRATRRSR
jgi:hypothetical protein